MTTEPWSIVGLGEILWDIFPDGPRFGGAPCNFACSAAELSRNRARARMVSCVGRDELGTRAIEQLTERGVTASAVQTDDRDTGQVLVEVDDRGAASYRFAENSAWDHVAWSDDLRVLAEGCDAVCFGTLGQRGEVSRQTIRRFVESVPPKCLRVLDINLRAPFDSDAVILESLPLANVLKLNDEELPRVAGLLGIPGTEREVIDALMDRYSYQLVALTRGTGGALILSGTGEFSDLPAEIVDVADTVGAGDAYTACLVLGRLAGCELAELNAAAIHVAAYVCSQPGATMEMPNNLRELF